MEGQSSAWLLRALALAPWTLGGLRLRVLSGTARSTERRCCPALPLSTSPALPCRPHTPQAGDASGTGLFDAQQRCWDEQRMGVIDPALRLCLPDLIGPEDVLGTLRPEVARELGLSENVIVTPGGSAPGALSGRSLALTSAGRQRKPVCLIS